MGAVLPGGGGTVVGCSISVPRGGTVWKPGGGADWYPGGGKFGGGTVVVVVCSWRRRQQSPQHPAAATIVKPLRVNATVKRSFMGISVCSMVRPAAGDRQSYCI